MDPVRFAQEMEGFGRPWWVVGGWAIEAATGYRREHEDTDVSILARDVPAFVEFMDGRWHYGAYKHKISNKLINQ